MAQRASAAGTGSYSITSTPAPQSEDMGRRMRLYAIQMALRVLCLIVFVAVDSWVVRIIAGVGVVVFPWSAVLLANVGADRSERSSSYVGPGHAPMIASAPAASAREETVVMDHDDSSPALEGEILAHDDDADRRTRRRG